VVPKIELHKIELSKNPPFLSIDTHSALPYFETILDAGKGEL
jgi:hypothetical protein